jgi:hypothetical protein
MEAALMKVIGIISTAALSLLLGTAALAYAQQDQKDEKKGHAEQQQSKQEAKPQPQHAQQQQSQHAQQQRQEQNKQQNRGQQQQRQVQSQQQPRAQQQRQQPQHAQQQRQDQQQAEQQQRQDQNNRQQRDQNRHRGNEQARNSPEQHRIQQSAWQEHRSQRWDSDHRTWQQRGGYNGYRVPDDRYRGYFGRDHGFRIYGLPFMVVGGYPRFQYEGYWITTVDPWPEYWGNDWYDNDDVYVVYVDNGYYLYNRRYPNVGIAIRISM